MAWPAQSKRLATQPRRFERRQHTPLEFLAMAGASFRVDVQRIGQPGEIVFVLEHGLSP